jgi:hypothetical protein
MLLEYFRPANKSKHRNGWTSIIARQEDIPRSEIKAKSVRPVSNSEYGKQPLELSGAGGRGLSSERIFPRFEGCDAGTEKNDDCEVPWREGGDANARQFILLTLGIGRAFLRQILPESINVVVVSSYNQPKIIRPVRICPLLETERLLLTEICTKPVELAVWEHGGDLQDLPEVRLGERSDQTLKIPADIEIERRLVCMVQQDLANSREHVSKWPVYDPFLKEISMAGTCSLPWSGTFWSIREFRDNIWANFCNIMRTQ